MDNLIINKEELQCTTSEDAIRLLEVKREYYSFSLYKAWMHHTSEEVNRITRSKKKPKPIYYIMVKHDELPFIVSEEVAREILDDPKKAMSYVINLWHWRYP